MTPKERTYIRSHLRMIWKWSPDRKLVRDRCRISKGIYRCEECKQECKVIDIDHKSPVGPTPGSRLGKNTTWDDMINNLFCSIDNLQGLCKSCHLKK